VQQLTVPSASSNSARPDASVRLADAERFAKAILPGVSRTFALSIRLLPGSLGRAVLAAYLLCRIADTVEDDHAMSPERKGTLLDLLVRALDDTAEAERFPAVANELVAGEPAHVELVGHADHVFLLYRSLPERSRLRVRHWVTEMASGMKKFAQRYPRGIRIGSLEEYREYCYYVAGTVGHMLTDLWHVHTRAIGVAEYRVLWKRCRAFGEGLQTVNILKDIAWDATRENAIYIPEESLRVRGSSHATLLSPDHAAASHAVVEEFIQLAWRDLDQALEYFVAIPRRAISIRAFCVLPLLFAYATLRELARSRSMLRTGETVKISRAEVKSLMVAGLGLVLSNGGVRRLAARVRRKRFSFLPGAARA
jgi:farnesyl-diphosphate farnesyltransferase